MMESDDRFSPVLWKSGLCKWFEPQYGPHATRPNYVRDVAEFVCYKVVVKCPALGVFSMVIFEHICCKWTRVHVTQTFFARRVSPMFVDFTFIISLC